MTDVDHAALPADELARLRSIDEGKIVHSWMAQDDYSSDIVVGAEGNYFWNADGKRFLDFTSQAWFAAIGHGNQHVIDAIIAQARETAPIYGFGTRPKLELADKLLSLLPPSYGRVFFGCNGSDANEIALKIARLVTGRQYVISFWHEYHGAPMGAASVTGVGRTRVGIGQPVPGTIFVPSPYHYRSPLGGATQEETDRRTIDFLRQTIEHTGPEVIAAVIGEPFVTAGAGVMPSRAYWQGVRALCDEYGILLVADEVVTGFGRSGHWFARDYYDYEPDVLVFAKGLSAGYLPLSAAVFTSEVVERFRAQPLPHGLTYSGHPLCCAAGLANLEVIERDDLVGNAARMAAHLTERLDALEKAHPSVAYARNLGLFGVIELVRDRDTKEGFPAGTRIIDGDDVPPWPGPQIVKELHRRGVIVRAQPHVVKFAPPLTITAAEIDLVVDHLDELLGRLDAHAA